MSRIYDLLKRAEASQPRLETAPQRTPRLSRVVTVTSNKGGVGKTTVATNLAVYLRGLRNDEPVLVLGLDEQPMADRMFAVDTAQPRVSMATVLRDRRLSQAIRRGRFDIDYVPTSATIFELKREISDPFHLERVIHDSGRPGFIVVDTKSDLEILTQNAIFASDLSIVVVKDQASLIEAEKVFQLLDEWKLPRERARVLLSLVDLRIKYGDAKDTDILSYLRREIERRGYPRFETFISRSPKIEALYTNPEREAPPIAMAARGSRIHEQMRTLADEVLERLDGEPPETGDTNSPMLRVSPTRRDRSLPTS